MYCRRWLGKQQWYSRLDNTDYYDENDYYCNVNEAFKMKLYTAFILAISILLLMTTPFCSILTRNVRGIMSSASSLSKLLDSHNIDFAFISEHKLPNEHNTFFILYT